MRLFEGDSVNHRGNLEDYSSSPHLLVAELKGLRLKVGISDFAKDSLAATYDYVMNGLTDQETYDLESLVATLLNDYLFEEFHELFREKANVSLFVYDEAENKRNNNYLKKTRGLLKEIADRNKEKVLKRRQLSVVVDGERIALCEKRRTKVVNALVDNIIDILSKNYFKALNKFGTDLSTSIVLFSDGVSFDFLEERMKLKRISDLAGEDVAVLWFDQPCQLTERHLYYYDDPKNEGKNGLISVKMHFVSGGWIMTSSQRDPTTIKNEIDSILKKLADKGIK